MFLALRDLRFARGRFALMGAVVALIAALGVLLSGLASGLADAGISGLRALPMTHSPCTSTGASTPRPGPGPTNSSKRSDSHTAPRPVRTSCPEANASARVWPGR